jgi:uncharacterized protein DUF1259
MSPIDLSTPMNRRRALALSGGVAGGLLIAGSNDASAASTPGHARLFQSGHLPKHRMAEILDAQADVSSGVVHFAIDRTDAKHVRGPQGVTFSGSFEINGDLYFQPLEHGRAAFFNGDIALKPAELNPVIDAILAGGLSFQAMHQHYFDLHPMWWFIHFRGIGEPLALTRAVKHVLSATATPFPQSSPSKPKTPLDVKRLERILRGQATVGDQGVVTVDVDRTDKTTIDGVRVNPAANISTNIEFLPLDKSGARVAAAPDFSMRTHEITPVTRLMRQRGWQDHCLYNQETGEYPQLYFSHMLKTGDAYALAQEIRLALDHTAT